MSDDCPQLEIETIIAETEEPTYNGEIIEDELDEAQLYTCDRRALCLWFD